MSKRILPDITLDDFDKPINISVVSHQDIKFFEYERDISNPNTYLRIDAIRTSIEIKTSISHVKYMKADIMQCFYKFRNAYNRDKIILYDLYLRIKDEKQPVLIADSLPVRYLARFMEQEIEKILDLDDEAVPEEADYNIKIGNKSVIEIDLICENNPEEFKAIHNTNNYDILSLTGFRKNSKISIDKNNIMLTYNGGFFRSLKKPINTLKCFKAFNFYNERYKNGRLYKSSGFTLVFKFDTGEKQAFTGISADSAEYLRNKINYFLPESILSESYASEVPNYNSKIMHYKMADKITDGTSYGESSLNRQKQSDFCDDEEDFGPEQINYLNLSDDSDDKYKHNEVPDLKLFFIMFGILSICLGTPYFYHNPNEAAIYQPWGWGLTIGGSIFTTIGILLCFYKE